MPSLRYCPQCASSKFKQVDVKQWACEQCQFSYFHNMASTAGALLIFEDELLLVERAINPQKGYWDLPGGFIEYGESLEQGLQRELNEELGLELAAENFRYFGSFANQYSYNQVLYHTCDSFFVYHLNNRVSLQARDDVAAWQWHSLKNIPFERVAFKSVKQGLMQLSQQNQNTLYK
ncbi:NUDIX domain-containing protein [Agarivorans sp. Alg241-V36]|uniref:NUDIX hydrolase n=1 Tax=Agarivorans sp. Alg241-V36 TaxID=2305992 RepID=UPI0013D3F4AB|nr:NUDIX domain-containing protein [Agarivorans sp. Alg241-V36]